MPQAHIHPSSSVDPRAEIAEDVVVHPFAVIEADTTIAQGSVIGSHAVIARGSRIGSNCHIGSHSVVAARPSDKGYKEERSLCVLGDRVQLGSYCVIEKAVGEGQRSNVGDDCFIVHNSGIAHNVHIGTGVSITGHVAIAGHAQIQDHAYIGLNCSIHQFCVVGTYAIVGVGSAILNDVLPFSMVEGSPARHVYINRVGLQRQGFSEGQRRAIARGYKALRKRDRAQLASLAASSAEVAAMLEFQAQSQRGICRFR